MHEKFRKESNDGVVSGKGWKTQGRKITKYTLLSLPPHPLFYANPNSGPCISLSSPPTFWSNEAIVERWTDRAFQLVAFMRLVILSKVSLPPQSLGTIREFAIPGVGGACAHRKREVWCRYLRILARISSLYDASAFLSSSKRRIRKDEIRRKLDNVKGRWKLLLRKTR